MNIRRLKQVCQYGWSDAAGISRSGDVKRSRFGVFFDILHCFLKYNVWSNQYKKERIFAIKGEEREQVCKKLQEKNTTRDRWVKEFFDNYKFLSKWSSLKYERSASLQAKRRAAYKKQYGLGENCFIGYDVILHRHHYLDSVIVTGKDCLIAEETNIDYTGGLTLGDMVSLSEGTKILTHNHDIEFSSSDLTKGCVLSPLMIGDKVWVGARSTILPGVTTIGRYASIGSGSVVRHPVPPYAIVVGNPAKIVGFLYTPEEVESFEKDRYPENEKTNIELYRKQYEKYFINRITDIKTMLSN